MDKLLLIEKELMSHPSFATKELEAFQELASNSSVLESCTSVDHDVVLESDDLLFSWPLLKRKRALAAAFTTTAGFAGLVVLVVGALLSIAGLQGLLSAGFLVECVFFFYHTWR